LFRHKTTKVHGIRQWIEKKEIILRPKYFMERRHMHQNLKKHFLFFVRFTGLLYDHTQHLYGTYLAYNTEYYLHLNIILSLSAHK